MTPFDLADLKERLSKHLGPISEEAAKAATTEIFAWLKDSCDAKDGAIYKMIRPALEIVEPMILKLEDSIAGT